MKQKQLSFLIDATGADQNWLWAAATACVSLGEVVENALNVPQMSFLLQQRDSSGKRLVAIYPGRMDDSIVPLSVYALTFALYLEHQWEDSTEQVTLLLDVRSSAGWRNNNGADLLGFIPHAIGLLMDKLPERFAQALVVPVPRAFSWVWQITKGCLGVTVATRVHLCFGAATKESSL